jgi:hypothetical protein
MSIDKPAFDSLSAVVAEFGIEMVNCAKPGCRMGFNKDYGACPACGTIPPTSAAEKREPKSPPSPAFAANLISQQAELDPEARRALAECDPVNGPPSPDVGAGAPRDVSEICGCPLGDSMNIFHRPGCPDGDAAAKPDVGAGAHCFNPETCNPDKGEMGCVCRCCRCADAAAFAGAK